MLAVLSGEEHWGTGLRQTQGAVARGWGCRAEPSSGDGVTLSLLADAQPRVCPTREAEGVLQDRLHPTYRD